MGFAAQGYKKLVGADARRLAGDESLDANAGLIPTDALVCVSLGKVRHSPLDVLALFAEHFLSPISYALRPATVSGSGLGRVIR